VVHPQRIVGIWENASSNDSTITISNNQFLNAPGTNPANNVQQAFVLTSHSSANSTVTYSNNTVSGASVGFAWLSATEFPGTDFSGNLPIILSNNTLTDVQTGFLVQSKGVAQITGTNTGTGTSTGTGIEVGPGSVVTVLGGSFTNTGVGVDVNGGTVLVQGANLNNDSIAGLRVQGGGEVDAGNGGYTGLGTSTGNNDFSSYHSGGSGRAIIDLNAGSGPPGTFVAAPSDVRAQNNIFASQQLPVIQQVIDDQSNAPTHGFVDFSNPQTVVVVPTVPPPFVPPVVTPVTLPPVVPPAPPHVFLFAVGGPNGIVSVYNSDGSLRIQGAPLPGYTGPLRVATGDLNGDGVDDILISATQGPFAGLVMGINGATLTFLGAFRPFASAPAGVNMAVGDLTGGGSTDLIVANASGASDVKAFSLPFWISSRSRSPAACLWRWRRSTGARPTRSSPESRPTARRSWRCTTVPRSWSMRSSPTTSPTRAGSTWRPATCSAPARPRSWSRRRPAGRAAWWKCSPPVTPTRSSQLRRGSPAPTPGCGWRYRTRAAAGPPNWCSPPGRAAGHL
jgi:hypothetical protein